MSLAQKIKRAYLSLTSKDDGYFSVGQVTYNGKTKNVEMVFPYGFAANPPLNSLCLVFNVMGDESNQAAIPSYPQMRFNNLAEGEVAVGNFVSQSQVYFKSDGTVQIYSKNADTNITVDKDMNVTVTGNLNVNVTGNLGVNVLGNSQVNINGETVSINGGGGNLNVTNSNINMGGTTISPSGHVQLGGGGPAIARVGDSVQVGSMTGTIISGSSNHTAS